MSNESTSNDRFSTEMPCQPTAGLRLVASTAEAWGGLWQAEGVAEGRLGIPVLAGLKQGWVAGPLKVHETGDGCRLEFTVEDSEHKVQKPALFFLIFAALGGLTTMVAPFIPSLLPLVPLGILVAIAAWFLIVSRLRNSGPEEFFADLAANATEKSVGADSSGM
jgi:hypothetical protein